MAHVEDVRAFVASTAPFDRLTDEDLHALLRACEIGYHPRGEELVPLRAAQESLGLIRKGVIAIIDAEGKICDQRAEGDTYGYPALLTGAPVEFAVTVVEDALIYHFPDKAFRAARAACPDFDRFFSSALVDRVRDGLRLTTDGDHGRLRIRDIMSSPVQSVDGAAPVREAARRMATGNISSLLVETQRGLAMLTDRDLRTRVLAADRGPDTPCAEVASFPLVSVAPDDLILDAMATMADRDLHHLPVLSGGEAVGMMSASDIYRARTSQPVFLAREIRRAGSREEVIRVTNRRDELFAHLVAQNAPPEHVGRLMSAMTDAATVRLIELAIEAQGPPPVPFTWLAFGSQARREQALRTDQDNGILLGEPIRQADEVWFEALAESVCSGLADAGIPLCAGGVMASNPHWRRDLAGWEEQFSMWIDDPQPRALMEASIFFDCRAVYGDETRAERLLGFVAERARDNRLFLRFLAQNALTMAPPLGLFRRFIVERDGSQGQGLNLKRRGLAPIVALARLRALEEGLSVASTHGRIKAVAAARPGDAKDLTSLHEAFDLIGQLRMEHQARRHAEAREPDNLVTPDGLSPLRREHLRCAFEVVRTAQRVIQLRFVLS